MLKAKKNLVPVSVALGLVFALVILLLFSQQKQQLDEAFEKSNETEEHSKRMEKYCHDIARKLQLSSKQMDKISLLVLLHDIGKVSVNPNILQKPGALTPAE